MSSTARRDLISPATRIAVRTLATNLIVRLVGELWQGHGFAPISPDELKHQDSSERRTEFMLYEEGVNWSDPNQVGRAILVFEDFIRAYRNDPTATSWLDDIRVQLQRDGFTLDKDGKIFWPNSSMLSRDLSTLRDASGIRIELERIRRDLTTDPHGAIGAAKQLIEATAKTALRERGIDPDKNAKINTLINTVQKALKLDAASALGGPDGTDSVKKILGGTVNIAIGVAELRNRGFGSGHGQASTPSGLGVRHARLAVNAATTWCELILDTLSDPAAPWLKNTT